MELDSEAMAALVAQRLDLEEAMRAVQMLELRLRNLTTSGPDSTDGALTPMKIKFLQQDYGFLDWAAFLRHAFQLIEHDLAEDTVVLVSQDFLRGLTKLVAEYSSSPASAVVLKNYLTWR